MVFNAIFSNISVLSWLSILLVEETGLLRDSIDLPQATDKMYHINVLLYRVHLAISGIRTRNSNGDGVVANQKAMRPRRP